MVRPCLSASPPRPRLISPVVHFVLIHPTLCAGHRPGCWVIGKNHTRSGARCSGHSDFEGEAEAHPPSAQVKRELVIGTHRTLKDAKDETYTAPPELGLGTRGRLLALRSKSSAFQLCPLSL